MSKKILFLMIKTLTFYHFFWSLILKFRYPYSWTWKKEVIHFLLLLHEYKLGHNASLTVTNIITELSEASENWAREM